MAGWFEGFWPWRRRSQGLRLRIRGVVAWPGPCATRRDAPRWTVQLTLASWWVVDGYPQGGDLRLVGEADDDALRQLQGRCPEGALVEADILLPLATDAPATLLAIVDRPGTTV